LLATDVRGGVVPDSGHWIPEEQPVFLVKLLNNFFSGNSTTTTTNNRTGIRSNNNNNSNLFLTYANDILGIRMQYPSNWSAREYKYNNTMTSSVVIATFYSPSKTASELGNISGVSDDFVPYLDISVFTVSSKEKSLEKIVNETINKFLKNPDTAINKESKPFTLKSKQPAYMLDYNTTIVGSSFRKMQLWTILDSKVCVVTFTSQQALFSNYIPIVKKMFNSFEIVNRPK
jgi:eukaryotic-like serine/threonine-protein kinase